MAEKSSGILEILFKLSTEELLSLAATVTQGLLRNKIDTRQEAIQAIINYSPDQISILRRKVITREILFDYLHEKKLPVTLPITKGEIIDKIVAYWKGRENKNPPRVLHRERPTTQVDQYQHNLSTYSSPLAESTSGSAVGDNTLVQRSSTENTYLQEYTARNENGQSTEIQRNIREDESIYLMAQQFSNWFYSLMNQNAPISTEHFYPDAALKLNVTSGGATNTEIVENNPSEISSLLFRTKMEHNLFFNPNISKEGVQGRMDPHGLVIVLACGTLHVNDICAGVFEQVFALARDPFADNNWKIKNTQLNMKSQQNVTHIPSLTDNELTSNYLSLPTS